MRFNSEAYDKLFPREADPAPAVESPVETFRPSQATAPDKTIPVDPASEDPVDPASSLPEETEVTNDDGSNSQLDSE